MTQDSAYSSRDDRHFHAGELTRGPWHPSHQHAGPPTALICRAVEQRAGGQGLGHLARLTVNLLRPVPIGELHVELSTDYAGRNAAHYSGRLLAEGKEVAYFTALAQREDDQPVPPGSAGPEVPRLPAECPRVTMPFAGPRLTYADLVETRLAQGRFFDGPCSAWFRLRHPLIAGEAPSPYQRVAVAADSGNGISAALDLQQWLFVNCDLTINLLRRPRGEWVCLQARSTLGGNGCGLAESALFDESGLVGRATQSLVVRRREGPASVQG